MPNLLNRQELDDLARVFAERDAFLFGVVSISEGDEKAALAAALRGEGKDYRLL